MRQATYTAERYFASLARMEAAEAELKRERRQYEGRQQTRRHAIVNLAEEWDKPDFTMEQKQAAIAETLTAVIIKPAGRNRQVPPGPHRARIPRKRHGSITHGQVNVTPAGNSRRGHVSVLYLLSFPHRHHRCPGSRSARPFVPIPPIAVARSSAALRPTPREWVLSPSLRSLASFRAWSLWPHLLSLTGARRVPSGTPGARLVRSSHRLCTRVYVQTRARGGGTRQPARRSLTVTAPRWSGRATVPG